MTRATSRRRVDYELIEDMIDPGAGVLDLGCGDGQLMSELIEKKQAVVRGVEKDDQRALECVAKGLSVYQGDLVEALGFYGNKSFDMVILSQTLQQTLNPRSVVREMLRVGKRGIISFPNFGHWSVRAQLALRGRMPRTRTLPYDWYDTPNVHLLTVKDFRDFCRAESVKVLQEIFLTGRGTIMHPVLPNLRSALAIFLIEK